MYENVKRNFFSLNPQTDFCSIRIVHEQGKFLNVRQNQVQPVEFEEDIGAMICVIHKKGMGYAATSDFSRSGLEKALQEAKKWAELSHQHPIFDYSQLVMPHPKGEYSTPVKIPWESVSLADKIQLLKEESEQAGKDEHIVDWGSNLRRLQIEQLYLTTGGGEVFQRLECLTTNIYANAYLNGESQLRSIGGGDEVGIARQGGLEVLDKINYRGAGARIAKEAVQILKAPNCPSETMDLILAPDQMMLQVHESIGHPLELDRILGDERNFAGTSFVTLDMMGEYQYGSKLLNVSFDPTLADEFASYQYDDEGLKAERKLIIEEGVLKSSIGGTRSQLRAGGVSGVANSRAKTWNRPPIDRMANLNVEPGDQSLDDLIGQVERGIYMATNRSWSIDDSRNKFQFGCEWGQLIENGELKGVVKNSNYRGISANFWKSLDGVGNAETVEIHGTPYCGKGEMTQLVRVGHASPACLFRNVNVFGG